jgi:hypothetical protein
MKEAVVPDDHREYIVEEITLDRDNKVETAVLANGRRFHIEFGPFDLREPGQSSPSTFELEYLALVNDIDELITEDANNDTEQSCQGPLSPRSDTDGVHDSGEGEKPHFQICNGECAEDPLESWILKSFLYHRTFQTLAPASSAPYTT